MKRVFVVCFTLLTVVAIASTSYTDLKSLFDADAVLETGGEGIGNPLDEDGCRIDAGTLPSTYQDGSPFVTQDGRTVFLFGTLQQASLDSMIVNGQILDVVDQKYVSLDLAMLSAPGSFGNPFAEIEFRYADGTSDFSRLGPIAGWQSSPTAYDNTFFRYTDDSQVQSIVSIRTNMSEDDSYYVIQEKRNGNSGGNRFIDGTGYALYLIDDLADVKQATLGVTVGNNFVISIATDYWDPDFSTTEGYTVLANSMEIHDNYEHRALGNLKQYTFDVSPFLAENTGELWLLFTDATPTNGWGPYLQNIDLFTGAAITFEETLDVSVDASNATVYALFQTDGNDEEKKYLYDNKGSGPSNRGHRFADGNGSITYRFDLPDDTTDAKITVDMANNFVVSLSGPSDVVRYDAMTVGSAEESQYLIDDGGSIPGDSYRFADGSSYMIYQFDLPDDITKAIAQIHIGNQFVIEVASGTDGDFQIAKDWIAESGQETTDNSNLAIYPIDISQYLVNNPSKIVRFRFTDGLPSNGWGPYLKSIVLVNQEESGETQFQPVLNAMDQFGVDIHNEINKDYYTFDLASFLVNNPKKEVFIQFTDASTGDGWGPGIFWMAAYSGELEILSDRRVFNDLKSTLGEPDLFGLSLLHRRYALNANKTLTEIAFPTQPADENDLVYVFASTLRMGDTAVSDWMLHE